MHIRNDVPSGGINPVDHKTIAVKSGVRAGGMAGSNLTNHNAVAVRCGVKAGSGAHQHNAVVVKSGVNAGSQSVNHNAVVVESGAFALAERP